MFRSWSYWWQNFEVLCWPAQWRPSTPLPGLNRPTFCNLLSGKCPLLTLSRKIPKQPNDLRPVGLTSLVTKTLEKIAKWLILCVVEPMLDPLQFACRAGWGVEEAKLFLVDKLRAPEAAAVSYSHPLCWLFFGVYPVQPHILAQKLISSFSLHHDLVLWIVDFLTDRCQQVVVTCTRSPQGFVLSPLLYILYTDDRRSNQENT